MMNIAPKKQTRVQRWFLLTFLPTTYMEIPEIENTETPVLAGALPLKIGCYCITMIQ
jgi:hypothetical protein